MTTNDKTREALAGEFAMSKFANSSDRCRALFDEVLRLRAALTTTPAQPPVAAVPESEAVAQLRHLVDDIVFLDEVGMHRIKPLMSLTFCNMVGAVKRLLAATPTPAPAAQGEAAAEVFYDQSRKIDPYRVKWLKHPRTIGEVKLYAAPERAEVRPPVLTEALQLLCCEAEAQCAAMVEGCVRCEAAALVRAHFGITPPSAADSAQGEKGGDL